MTGPISNARDAAVLALRDREGNVTAHLGRVLAQASLSSADSALAREVAMGVVRRRATLQAVLRAFLARPERRLPGALNQVLEVGLYQLLFLQRVPGFAAVNEAVEQAGRFRHKRQSGLVNGVLRTVARDVGDFETGEVPPAADVLPVGPRSYRRFGRPVFPDPSAEPVEYLAAAHSLSVFLAERWCRQFGSLAAAVQVATHAHARPPLILRVNEAAADVDSVVAELASQGVSAEPHENGRSVVLADRCDVTALDLFRRGAVQPQDPTATAVVAAAAPRPGTRVLDLCAAPGTKTTHLAELMGNEGWIIACDVSPEKIQRIEDNCRRMGVTIVQTMLADGVGALETGTFDLVLADVPCSNTGVLARRPEARWRLDEQALKALVQDQRFLIRAAAGFVRPGGRLVYSTCSLEGDEDSRLAHWLAQTDKRMRLAKEDLVLPAGADEPTCWHDGGYLAIFEAG